MHGLPFVTCLCLTRNRRDWLPKAIRQFQLQTYPNKELLILADGESVQDLIPNDDRIRLVHIVEGYRIGEKRNFGASLAAGDIIIHWDDDDYSAPGRIEDQVQRLQESGMAATGYHTMLFTNGQSWWTFLGPERYALGTSLCYRKSWWRDHPFTPKQNYEDGDFVNEANQHNQLLSVNAGELMVASIHSGNTSPRHVERDGWPMAEFAGIPGWPE